MSDDLDLFGNPVRPGKGCRGRPAYERTLQDENAVKLGLALGWSNERIAQGIDISTASLKRHFRAVLKDRSEMRSRLELAMFRTVVEKAMHGHMGAMGRLIAMIDRNDLMLIDAKLKGRQEKKKPEAAEPAPQLGKKELAAAAADRVAAGNSSWGDDLLYPGSQVN